jgi:hypothetical protein
MCLRALATSALLLCTASVGSAQTDRPAASVEGIVGHAAFLDEDPIDHVVAGGVLRYPISARLSVGPEVVYMIGPGQDRDLFLTGNVWFDFLGPRGDGVRRVTPYLVVGAGLMRHTDEFITDFTVHEWAATGGLGVRIALNDCWYVAPEARLGWEAHSRINVTVGYRFGR